jgi:acetaldehyde dehydrogenase/alcohol dehydrogenase
MVTDTKSLEELIRRVKAAQVKFATFSQEQVDHIFREAALAANSQRIPLARMAVEETQMGVLEDKVIKNHYAAEYIYNKYKCSKTCGVIEEDVSNGFKKIAEPVGVVAGVIPTTNPTSTAIFKSLLCLKTRNGIIFAPHPRATKSTIAATKIVLDAAVKAGAPEDIIGWIDTPTIELTQFLMQNKDINVILATGGPAMVKAAYSSGKPAIGVGPGNTPAVIDETVDIEMAVSSILISKTFDNGTICASEQSVVVVDSVYEKVKAEFLKRGAYILSPAEKKKVASTIIIDGKLNGAIAGQSPQKIAEMAGIKVSDDVKVLIGEASVIGVEEAFAFEKLSPVLGMYKAKDFDEAVEKAIALIRFGGMGHTSALYTAPSNKERIAIFSERLETGRVLINTPSSQGAIGDLYNFRLTPSLTLGCGSWGGNSVSENVGINQLLNIKTVAERRENMLWFRVPPKIYFKYGCLGLALDELKDRKKAFIVTDKPLFDLGYINKVTDVLEKNGTKFEVFYDVNPDPSFADVLKGLARIKEFQPDLIIALGGGSPMDASKIMWLMYEHPEVDFAGLAMRFMDIRKRIYKFPELGKKAYFVCVPTTSGTGSEVTPFAVVTDGDTGIKYPIADYELTPNMAIIDPELVMSMPKKLTAFGGVDALTHAVEAYVSVFSNDFTSGEALKAIEMVFKYLPESYHKGAEAREAKEKMHYAATIAGMAFANSFLGITHSLAHTLGSTFHIPHGLANALLITQVINYNRTEKPKKQAAFSQYQYPVAKERYAEIADFLRLGGKTLDEKVDRLIAAIEKLKADVEIPKSIEEAGVTKADFEAKLDMIADRAFDDQCTGGNPRYPLIEDIKELYMKGFRGEI